MIDKQRLEEKCSTWNIALTGTQLDQLDAFAQILVDYNQKVNLTAITDPEGIEDKGPVAAPAAVKAFRRGNGHPVPERRPGQARHDEGGPRVPLRSPSEECQTADTA